MFRVQTLFGIFGMILCFSGCTQIVTAPIAVAGAVVTTTFDVAGAAVDAVVPGD